MSVLTIGSFIELKRKQQGLTQDDLAAQAGTSRLTLMKLENGEGDGVAFGTVMNVLAVLGFDLDAVPLPSLTTKNYVTPDEYAQAWDLLMAKWDSDGFN